MRALTHTHIRNQKWNQKAFTRHLNAIARQFLCVQNTPVEYKLRRILSMFWKMPRDSQVQRKQIRTMARVIDAIASTCTVNTYRAHWRGVYCLARNVTRQANSCRDPMHISLTPWMWLLSVVHNKVETDSNRKSNSPKWATGKSIDRADSVAETENSGRTMCDGWPKSEFIYLFTMETVAVHRSSPRWRKIVFLSW